MIGKLLDRGYARLNATAGAAFILLLIDPASLEDSSFQMTFAAVLAVRRLGVPAGQWALGWLREALKDFDETNRRTATFDRDLRLASLSKRIWCDITACRLGRHRSVEDRSSSSAKH